MAIMGTQAWGNVQRAQQHAQPGAVPRAGMSARLQCPHAPLPQQDQVDQDQPLDTQRLAESDARALGPSLAGVGVCDGTRPDPGVQMAAPLQHADSSAGRMRSPAIALSHMHDQPWVYASLPALDPDTEVHPDIAAVCAACAVYVGVQPLVLLRLVATLEKHMAAVEQEVLAADAAAAVVVATLSHGNG